MLKDERFVDFNDVLLGRSGVAKNMGDPETIKELLKKVVLSLIKFMPSQSIG